MSLQKQARALNEKQLKNAIARTSQYRNGLRNKCIIELTCFAGLRAKEVGGLRWEHILDNDGKVGLDIRLTNDIAKGTSGGVIPVNATLRQTLIELYGSGKNSKAAIIQSEQGKGMKTQSIINLLWNHYKLCDIEGASSHSGRRTYITSLARKVSLVGCSLKDVQILARHKNLQSTQRYIEQNTDGQRKLIDLI